MDILTQEAISYVPSSGRCHPLWCIDQVVLSRLGEVKFDAMVHLASAITAFCKYHFLFSSAHLVSVSLTCFHSLAVLYFDYLLTLEMEVERFWKKPFSCLTFGFFLNRYLSLLAHIPVMYELIYVQTPSVSRVS